MENIMPASAVQSDWSDLRIRLDCADHSWNTLLNTHVRSDDTNLMSTSLIKTGSLQAHQYHESATRSHVPPAMAIQEHMSFNNPVLMLRASLRDSGLNTCQIA